MIATIETNPSKVLALPVAAASGSGSLSPRTLGGFASTLAAAKASPQAQDSATSAEETECASSPEAGDATTLSGKITAGNGQTKKSQGGPPTAQIPLRSNVATAIVPTANPVANTSSSLPLQPGLTQSVPASLSVTLPVEAAVVPQENILAGWQTVNLQGDPLAGGSNSSLNLGGKISATPDSFGGSQNSLTRSFGPNTSVPTANAPNSFTAATSTVAKTIPLSLSNAEVLPSSAALSAVPGTVVVKSTAESSQSLAGNGAGAASLPGNGERSGALLQGSIPAASDNAVENAGAAAPGSGSGTLPAQAVQPAGDANEPANVPPGSGAGSEVLIASAEISSAPLRDDSAPTGGVPANPASGMNAYGTSVSGSSVSGTNDAAIALAEVANPAPQFSPGRTTLPLSFHGPNISKVASAITTPNVGAVAGNSGATTPAAASTLPGDASPQSMLVSQTPFSIFFSSSSASPGPGTESAASTLPKMILPGAAAAIRDGHGNGNGQDLTANPQAGSAQTNAIQTSSHGATPQIVKDALADSGNGTVPAGQPLHNSAGANAANVPLAAASVSATIPAAANSPAVTSPLAATASMVSESQAKANTLPAASSAGPNNAVPTLPETPVIAAPGPVQMAQMVNRVEQSEMRIGMTTSAFGSVEVRTVVHANDVGLVIGSEKGDLRTLLSNDMPAIASILQEKNLTLHSVNFMQGFAFSNNAPGGGGSQQQSFVPARMPSAGEGSEAAAEDSQDTLPRPEWSGASGSLSILA